MSEIPRLFQYLVRFSLTFSSILCDFRRVENVFLFFQAFWSDRKPSQVSSQTDSFRLYQSQFLLCDWATMINRNDTVAFAFAHCECSFYLFELEFDGFDELCRDEVGSFRARAPSLPPPSPLRTYTSRSPCLRKLPTKCVHWNFNVVSCRLSVNIFLVIIIVGFLKNIL